MIRNKLIKEQIKLREEINITKDYSFQCMSKQQNLIFKSNKTKNKSESGEPK